MPANLLNIVSKKAVICKLEFAEHLNYSKAKAGDSTNTYNQTYNSRAAVFDSFL